jgi:hypothetical protein
LSRNEGKKKTPRHKISQTSYGSIKLGKKKSLVNKRIPLFIEKYLPHRKEGK